MDFSCYNNFLVVRTPFSDKDDLVQIFSGVCLPDQKPALFNMPVDFHAAGLVRKNVRDIWHIDRVLAYSTDEATPLLVGKANVGANHGFPCLVKVTSSIDSSVQVSSDSVFLDEESHPWRLIREEKTPVKTNVRTFLFLGEYMHSPLSLTSFRKEISGSLSLDSIHIPILQQQGQVDLKPIVRHESCEVCFNKEKDTLQINETYVILHPGFLSPNTTLTSGDFARMTHQYTIEHDGRILVDFSITSLTEEPIQMDEVLGIMYQEKCDLGGGVWRVIEGIKPFEAENEDGILETFDFSKPINTSSTHFPKKWKSFASEYWANPSAPIIKQTDYLKDATGDTVAAFEAGFTQRSRSVHVAWTMASSRKTYPMFADQFILQPGETISGQGYRRYFQP